MVDDLDEFYGAEQPLSWREWITDKRVMAMFYLRHFWRRVAWHLPFLPRRVETVSAWNPKTGEKKLLAVLKPSRSLLAGLDLADDHEPGWGLAFEIMRVR